MESIIEKVNQDYLLGIIKHSDRYSFYLMPIAYWILNYSKYDPGYDPVKWESVFRDNILNVEDGDVQRFLQAIKPDELSLDSLIHAMNDLQMNGVHFVFFIDFDSKLYINGFSDIEVEDYLPNSSWVGKQGSPIAYLPEKMRMKIGV